MKRQSSLFQELNKFVIQSDSTHFLMNKTTDETNHWLWINLIFQIQMNNNTIFDLLDSN